MPARCRMRCVLWMLRALVRGGEGERRVFAGRNSLPGGDRYVMAEFTFAV